MTSSPFTAEFLPNCRANAEALLSDVAITVTLTRVGEAKLIESAIGVVDTGVFKNWSERRNPSLTSIVPLRAGAALGLSQYAK